MADLGAGPGVETRARAYGVSGDGNRIVGTRTFKEDQFSSIETKAFVCTFAAGVCTFLNLIDGIATVITEDGSVVAGWDPSPGVAFRWTNAGGAQSLGALAGYPNSAALGISDSGKIVVGLSGGFFDFLGPGGGLRFDEAGTRAFRWTAATGMRDLNQLLADAGVNMAGLTLVSVTSISQDGQWMTGAATTPDTEPGETVPFLAHYCDAAIQGECYRRFDRLIVGDLDVNPRDDLVIDTGPSGIWAFFNGATWTKLHASTSGGLALGDFSGNGRDDLLVDFGVGGLWVRYDSGAWTKIHNTSPLEITTARLDSIAKEEAVVDFGAGGLWSRFNNSTWSKLHAGAPLGQSAGDLDGNGVEDLLVDFGTSGLWARYNNATWLKLHSASPDDFLTARLDNNTKREAVVDFGSSGLWARFNNATWTKLHVGDPIDLAAGNLDGNGVEDLLVNFGPSGLWARYNNATWIKLHSTSPAAIAAADLDNSGRAEAVADFGAGNIWARYNNSRWVKLPALPP